MSVSSSFNELFKDCTIDIKLRKALSRLNFTKPTLIQTKSLPLALNHGKDLVIQASTGSGKTLAYALPLLQKILENPRNKQKIQALILVPTRELVTQTMGVLKELTYYCDDELDILPIVSNSVKQKEFQIEVSRLERDEPQVMISTPAGLVRHFKNDSDNVNLKHVKTLVVDEADLIFSFGFQNDLNFILKHLKKGTSQIFLVSATFSSEVQSLKKLVMHNPATIKLLAEERNLKAGKLKQFYLRVPPKDKNLVLYCFLKLGLLRGKGIFFVSSIDKSFRLKLFLEQFSIQTAVLNSELPALSRQSVLEHFNAGNFDYLIATDEAVNVNSSKKRQMEESDDSNDESDDEKKRKKDGDYGVSRGLDFRGVSFVVNVDFPDSVDSYTHRIGRTARGGANGVALSLVDETSLKEQEMLVETQASQPTLPPPPSTVSQNDEIIGYEENNANTSILSDAYHQPSPLEFDLKEIEGFRYRVEDVSRAVTKMAVKEARISELKAEMLNSERLKGYFEENPQDLQILRHDRQSTHSSKVQEHLKIVPKYLLPRGMQVVDTKKRKRKKISMKTVAKRTDNDPLHSYDAAGEAVNLDGINESKMSLKKKIKSAGAPTLMYSDPRETGESTAGRNLWKERHRKGKWSKKKNKNS